MKLLPVLLSIPHGGVRIPKEVESLTQLSPADVFAESDPFAGEIFRLQDRVLATVIAPLSRLVVDVDRPASQQPPAHPDGALKAQTSTGTAVYAAPLAEGLAATLIETYHKPYHDQIQAGLVSAGLKVALDCHSMAPVGPASAPDAGQKRPMVYLSNGNQSGPSHDLLERLADCMAKAFRLPRKSIVTDGPYLGNFLPQTYGNTDLPWIEVWLNRSLYLDTPAFGPNGPTNDPKRLKELNWSWDRSLHALLRGRDGSSETLNQEVDI